MSGYTGAGPGAGAGGGMGAGMGANPSAFMGGMPTYQGVQGQGVMGGSPMGTQLPSTVQRMPGGFGISPQLLQMIAGLNKAPQGQPTFNVAQFQPKPFVPVQYGPNNGYSNGYGDNGPR